MLEMAECLAADEPFLRVDFYAVGKPMFGELTLSPEAGIGIFDPPEGDARIRGPAEGWASASSIPARRIRNLSRTRLNGG
jgi:hypothetical protein